MKMLYPEDLKQSITPLIQKGTLLKATLIKSKVFSKPIEMDKIQMFKSTLDNFLNQWTSYANKMNEILPTLKNVSEGNYTVMDYNFVKDFIFSSYDYSSIKSFLDGIVLGINDGKIKRPRDIEDFFNHTIKMAFDGQTESVAELTDKCSNQTLSLYSSEVSMYDIKMFNSVRTYNMFDKGERIDIYKSITGAIESLTRQNKSEDLCNAMSAFINNYDSSKMWSAVIGKVVDYAIYSAVAYASRIYVLIKYINDFQYTNSNIRVVNESTGTSSNIDNIMKNINPANCWGSIDLMFIKDPANIIKFLCKYRDFLTLLGIRVEHDIDEGLYVPENILQGNEIYNKIKDNDLLILLKSWYHISEDRRFYTRHVIKFEEFNHRLKCATTNPLHALDGTSNSKNELLHLIRKDDYYGKNPTVNNYKKMAEDLYYVSTAILWYILRAMDEIKVLIDKASDPFNSGFENPYTDKKRLSECMYMLTGLYEDIIFAISQQVGYIESSINKLQALEKKELSNKFSITDPSAIINDATLFSTTTTAVPETLRIPVESENLFTLSSFEEACLVDELIRSTPGFENNLYLSEAGASNVMNMIISLIQGLINSASIFFFKNFKPASDWVAKNKDALLKINFSKDDKIYNVYNYNLDIQNNIINGISTSKLIDGLKNINRDEISKDVDKWVKSLYPSDEIYNWFTSDEKKAAIKYRNKVLFNTESDKPAVTVELAGDALKKEFATWVNDILHAPTVANMLIKTGKEIDQAVKNLKSKVVTESVLLEANENGGDAPDVASNRDTNRKDANNNSGTTSPNTSTSEPSNRGNSNEKANEEKEPKVEMNGQPSGIPLTKVTEVITRTWKPLYDGVIQVFRDEYKNIKAIYQQSLRSSNYNQDQSNK